MHPTRPLLLALTLALASPAIAQDFTMPRADTPAPQADSDPIADLMGNIFQNLLQEALPHLNNLQTDMEGVANALLPLAQDLGNLIDDMGNYNPPERLENGDILIRRKADAPPPPPVSDRLMDLTRPPAGSAPSLPPGHPPLDMSPKAPELEL